MDATIHTGTILAYTAGKARYQLSDGSVGGPTTCLRSATHAAAGGDEHTHVPPSPVGKACLVIMIGGQRSGAWVIPEEV